MAAKKVIKKKEKAAVQPIEVAEVKPYRKKPVVEEAEAPGDEIAGYGAEDAPEKDCRSCRHPSKMHYEGAHRQCNTSGCPCTRYLK